jgi:protein-glutamine gamma-glutamyltransferase
VNSYPRYHTISHLLVVTSIVTYAVAGASPGVAVVGLPLAVGSWLLFKRTLHSPVPRLAINLLLLAATVWMAMRATGAPDDLVAVLAEYLVALLLIKQYEQRTPRDQAQSLTLAIMLIIGAVLTGVTVVMGPLLLLAALALLPTAMLYQVFAGEYNALEAQGRDHDEALARAHPAATREVRRAMRAVAFPIAIVTLVSAMAIFVLVPRGDGPRITQRLTGPNIATTTGFRDHMQLGSSGFISSSPALVGYAQITFNGTALTSPETRYFRGATLDLYRRNTFSWSRSPRLQLVEEKDRALLRPGNPDRGFRRLPETYDHPDLEGPTVAVEQTIELVNKDSGVLFALGAPVQIAQGSGRPVAINPIDRTLRLEQLFDRISYRVRSTPDFWPAPPEWAAELLPFDAWRRELNAFDPEAPLGAPILELTQAVLEPAGLERPYEAQVHGRDDEIARAIEQHLQSQYAYSTRLRAPEDDTDPILYFLADSREGHCEYFASAMTAMLRTQGINARVVTGLATSEVDREREVYVLRRSHAHAWVEVPVMETFSQPDGAETQRIVWRTYDPSPAADVAALSRPPSGVIAWFSDAAVALEDFWLDNVVTFNSERQENLIDTPALLESLNDRIASLSDSGEATAQSQSLMQRMTSVLLPVFLGVAGLVSLGFGLRGAIALLGGGRSRTGPARAATTRDERRLAACAAAVDDALRKAGHPRPEWRPPLEHLRMLAGTHAALADAAATVYRLWYESAYAGRPVTPETLGRAGDAARQATDAARRSRSGPAPA